jgi:hypothetical protein
MLLFMGSPPVRFAGKLKSERPATYEIGNEGQKTTGRPGKKIAIEILARSRSDQLTASRIPGWGSQVLDERIGDRAPA